MPAQQFDTQLQLQGLQGMGHGRLGNTQAIGRCREAVEFGHEGENLQLSEGHECLLILR
ncbi:hypothetical protein D3C80_1354480 [compost metagenome]